MRSRFVLCMIIGLAVIISGCGSTEGVKKDAVADGSVKKERRIVLLINCAAEADYTDKEGRIWKKDQEFQTNQWGYVGGSSVIRDTAISISNTEDDNIYLNERYGLRAYRIPLENGVYTVKLHFAETWDGISSDGERVYTVNIEGKEAFKDLDPFKEAGSRLNTAAIKEIKVTIEDGELTIEFIANIQNPLINGIEIIQ